MATLRNLALGLLVLAGISEITRTLQRIVADRTRNGNAFLQLNPQNNVNLALTKTTTPSPSRKGFLVRANDGPIFSKRSGNRASRFWG